MSDINEAIRLLTKAIGQLEVGNMPEAIEKAETLIRLALEELE